MGNKDTSEKMLEDFNDVFADIINVLLFDGKQIIHEDELETSSLSSFYKHENKNHVIERDVGKYWKGNAIRLALFGMENQTNIDPNMPIRVMCYDSAAYRVQMSEDILKRYPVITLVLYMGWEKKWNNYLRLSECLEITPELKPFVQDYEIKVVNMAWLSDEQIEMFQSDFKILAKLLRSLRLKKDVEFTNDEIKHTYEILELFNTLTQDELYAKMRRGISKADVEKKGVAYTMKSMYSLALERAEAKAAEEAKKKTEEKTTREIAFRMKESGMQLSDIAKITQRSTETLKQWFASSKVQSV